MLTFRFSEVNGQMVESDLLTSGMVGRKCRIEFTNAWDDLEKTVVFTAGKVTRDVINVGELVEIPAECIAVENVRLHVGVYGVGAGKIIPTIIVPGPYILPGADPSGDESTNPELPVWAQLQEQIDALKQSGAGGGLNISADDEGNVFISSTGSVSIKDDGSGNVTIE